MSGATRWAWLTKHTAGRILAFCYDAPHAGPSAKGAIVGDPPTRAEIRAAIDSPDRTVRTPEAFGLVPIKAAEALALGLPQDPPWIGFFSNKPVPPPRDEPSRDVRATVTRNGAPVEGAEVRMGYVSGRIREMLRLDTRTTDASGVCVFPLAPLTDHFRTVVAIAKLHGATSRMVDVAEDGTVALELVAAGELCGEVTRLGKRVPAHFSIWSGDGGVHQVVRGKGTYRIHGIVPGTYTVQVRGIDPETRMSAGTPTFDELVIRPGESLQRDYQLVAGQTIHLRVHVQHEDDSCTGYLLQGEHHPATSTELRELLRTLDRHTWRTTNSSRRKNGVVRAKLLDVPVGTYTVCTHPHRLVGGRVPEQPVVSTIVTIQDQDIEVALETAPYRTLT